VRAPRCTARGVGRRGERHHPGHSAGFPRPRSRAGGAYANPPAEIWSFRDYTGAQEGLDVTGSYGTDRVRGTFTGGGWHSDGYREQDRRNHWQTAGKASCSRPGHPRHRLGLVGQRPIRDAAGLVHPRHLRRPRAGVQPFMIDASGRGSLTRSDKGYLAGTVDHHASEGLGWHARASWGRTHFTDFQPARDDWGVANRFGLSCAASFTLPATVWRPWARRRASPTCVPTSSQATRTSRAPRSGRTTNASLRRTPRGSNDSAARD